MAAPNIRAGSAVTGQMPGLAVSTVLDKPVGTVSGDLIVYLIAYSNNAPGAQTPPAGFTSPTGLTGPLASGGSSAILLVKVAGASEPATYTHAWASGTSGTWAGVAVSNIAGSWQDAVGELVGSTADTAHIVPSIDPGKTEGLLLAAVASDNAGTALTVTYDTGTSGLVKQAERVVANTATAALFTQTLPNANPTGVKTVTASTASRFVAFGVVISSPTSVVDAGTPPPTTPHPWRIYAGTTELRAALNS